MPDDLICEAKPRLKRVAKPPLGFPHAVVDGQNRCANVCNANTSTSSERHAMSQDLRNRGLQACQMSMRLNQKARNDAPNLADQSARFGSGSVATTFLEQLGRNTGAKCGMVALNL